MAERGVGQKSWRLSPYDVNVSFSRSNSAGEAEGLVRLRRLRRSHLQRWPDGSGTIRRGIIFQRCRAHLSRSPFRRCEILQTVTISCGL
jgi:hypothetical protein